jgi:2-dehydropantoate 2-reductase
VPLPLLDLDGALWRHVGPQRALGCVVYSANEVAEPGVVVHSGFDRWIVGEPDGSDSDRLHRVCSLFTEAGLTTERTANIRHAIWHKLLANASGNTLAALTRLSAGALNDDAQLLAFRRQIVEELLATGAALGIDLRNEVDLQAIAAAAPALRNVRASMLQDVLIGRPLEVEAILGQPHAFAQASGVATPALDVLTPLLRGLDRSLRRPAD